MSKGTIFSLQILQYISPEKMTEPSCGVWHNASAETLQVRTLQTTRICCYTMCNNCQSSSRIQLRQWGNGGSRCTFFFRRIIWTARVFMNYHVLPFKMGICANIFSNYTFLTLNSHFTQNSQYQNNRQL